jgi:hypothetical protein
MENDDLYDELNESFVEVEGNLQVLDVLVPVELQMNYFRYSKRLQKTFRYVALEAQIEALQSPQSTFDEIRYAMAYLAVSGEVKAYRALEAYSQNPANQPPSYWLTMSLLQARITLESAFSDEKQIYIASGLGGNGRKMRFYGFFKSEGLRPFTPYQRDLIAKEFPFHIHRSQGEVEELRIEDTYFSILFLIDVQADISTIMLGAINECNEYGHFIQVKHRVTNDKTFSEEDIRRELQER